MAFKDKEEFFDGLFSHLFEGDTPDDSDQEWFEKKVIPFFDQFPGFTGNNDDNDQGQGTSPVRRRSGQSSGSVSGPRRKRRQSSGGNSEYGANIFFGGN